MEVIELARRRTVSSPWTFLFMAFGMPQNEALENRILPREEPTHCGGSTTRHYQIWFTPAAVSLLPPQHALDQSYEPLSRRRYDKNEKTRDAKEKQNDHCIDSHIDLP
jgi:hypothetical protein